MQLAQSPHSHCRPTFNTGTLQWCAPRQQQLRQLTHRKQRRFQCCERLQIVRAAAESAAVADLPQLLPLDGANILGVQCNYHLDTTV